MPNEQCHSRGKAHSTLTDQSVVSPNFMKSHSLIIQSALMLSALAACGQGTFIYDQSSATTRSFSGGAPIQGQEPTGQSFTPALSSVGFVQLELSDFNPGNGVGATVYVNLRAGSLTGTIMGSTDPVFMPDGFSYGVTNFFFAAPAAVNPGTVYYLEPTLQSGDHWDIIIGSYNYPGGTFFANGLPNPNAFDVWFREGSIVPEPPSGLLVLLGIAGVCAARRARRFRTKCQAAVLIGLLASAGAASAQLHFYGTNLYLQIALAETNLGSLSGS